MSDELFSILEKVSSASVYSALWKMGYKNCWIRGVFPATINDVHIVGKAVTVRYLPFKKAVDKDYERQRLLTLTQILEKGDVIVMDACSIDAGAMGDCMAAGFKMKGVVAVVIDGGVRDVPMIKKVGLPVFAKYVTPAHSNEKIMHFEINTTIECGGVQVHSGDIIVADDDGVMAIPKEVVKEVAELGWKYERLDEEARKRILKGIPLGEAYPPKEEWLKE